MKNGSPTGTSTEPTPGLEVAAVTAGGGDPPRRQVVGQPERSRCPRPSAPVVIGLEEERVAEVVAVVAAAAGRVAALELRLAGSGA